ncbi:hypothetical protein SKAU_G00021570 [Synaphobranchus kaupii]|uniref:HAT C-terminal dimerisation domain-containing protein n=1 Tax=Synaphobranchus kaupii TaxID=118154 RepID=A0A9Q1GBY8_SYNKA|nr:hypothetical protein SKAU_G00021570 [Synaphobranchus kaupii]
MEENPTGEGQSQSLLDSLYDDMLLRQQAQPEPPDGLLEKLERYLKEPVPDRKSGDPLQWWKQDSGRFLNQSSLARRFLTPPLSSIPSERVFSTVGNIYEDKRSSLAGANAEKLCFLFYNLPLIDWQY